VREVNGNVFDTLAFSEINPEGYTFLSNYFGAGFVIEEYAILGGAKAWYLQDNFIRFPMSAQSLTSPLLPSPSRHNYWLMDEAVTNNPHGPGVGLNGKYMQGEIVDPAGHLDYQDSSFYMTLFSAGPPADSCAPDCIVSITNSIFIPNMDGGESWWVSALVVDPDFPNSGGGIVIDHNTIIADTQDDGGVPVYTAHATSPANTTGQLYSYQNNIIWSNGRTPTYKLFAAQNINLDVCHPAKCDYNDGWRTLTDGGESYGYTGANGYADNFTSPPGVHDLAVDPMFVDPTRNMATFDSGYLGNHPPAWNSSASYNVGDMVSSTDASVYAGITVNYRYINNIGCDATNPKPGLAGGTVLVTKGSPTVTWVSGPKFNVNWTSPSNVSGQNMPIGPVSGFANHASCGGVLCTIAALSDCIGQNCTTITLSSPYTGPTGIQPYFANGQPLQSRACWEWASLYRIREGVASQTLYEDSSIGVYGNDIITTLEQWVRAGFSPTNSALALAGSDGEDIGAVPVTFMPSMYPALTPGGLIMRGATGRGGVVR
jgi:hypothetical protein